MHFRPINVSPIDSYNQVYTLGYGNLEYQLLAASMGLVSISPEKMGYGEATDLVPTLLQKKSVVTGSLPLFEKANSLIEEMSGGKTRLGDEAYFMGYVRR